MFTQHVLIALLCVRKIILPVEAWKINGQDKDQVSRKSSKSEINNVSIVN